MFTGIVTAIGKITRVDSRGGDLQCSVSAPGLDSAGHGIGASISVQGVCLTVTRSSHEEIDVDISRETLTKTTLGKLVVGSRVNLEPALRAGDALGGHLVSGHVDGVGRLVSVREEGRSTRLEFELSPELARFVAPKGSICLDGVSLTVNAVQGARFDVNIIPFTQGATTLGERRDGDGVNVEIDLIARYLDRLLART